MMQRPEFQRLGAATDTESCRGYAARGPLDHGPG